MPLSCQDMQNLLCLFHRGSKHGPILSKTNQIHLFHFGLC
jgi:hypothetical protein